LTLALLTGASRGIGRATALALADRECDLVLVGRPGPALEGVAATCEKSRAERVDCDLANRAELERTAARLAARRLAPDCVIHAAGVCRRAPLKALEVAAYDEQIDVNLRAPYVLTRALLPAMLERRSGRIIFLGSISSTLGTPHQTAYNASKWGLLGLMKSLAEELKDSGVITLAVLPGAVDTEMLAGSGFEPRMTAAEVARTLAFFALDASSAHNGAAIEMFGT
jgi:3-oxoacyl-[acyl-carrier protein] reductase